MKNLQTKDNGDVLVRVYRLVHKEQEIIISHNVMVNGRLKLLYTKNIPLNYSVIYCSKSQYFTRVIGFGDIYTILDFLSFLSMWVVLFRFKKWKIFSQYF